MAYKTMAVPEWGGVPPRLALLWEERLDSPSSAGGRYWVASAKVVQIEPDGSPRWLSRSEQPLAGIRISAQLDNEPTMPDTAYGASVRFQDDSAIIDAEWAERIGKSLRLIAKRMDALATLAGRPTSYGQFIVQAMAAMGITTLMARPVGDGPHRWLSDGQYLTFGSAEVQSFVADRERVARATLTGQEVPA